MGKGQGCVPSKFRQKLPLGGSPPVSPKKGEDVGAETGLAAEREIPIQAPAVDRSGIDIGLPPPSKKLKVYIIFYSMYGHVETLAKSIKAGVDSVEGVEGCLFRVQETLSLSVLQQMRAPPKDETVPVISPAQLTDADGLIFGFPTRYGAMAAQMKAFFDSTGQLWREQRLAGKPAGVFVSTGTQGGGQETTAWTALTQLVHHGMLYVPIGYTFGAGMFNLDKIKGGSPYGAGTFAGDGMRKPSGEELALAEHQGKYTAGIVKKLIGG
eukprot:c21484_g1_i1 orf=695-1498(+)